MQDFSCTIYGLTVTSVRTARRLLGCVINTSLIRGPTPANLLSDSMEIFFAAAGVAMVFAIILIPLMIIGTCLIAIDKGRSGFLWFFISISATILTVGSMAWVPLAMVSLLGDKKDSSDSINNLPN